MTATTSMTAKELHEAAVLARNRGNRASMNIAWEAAKTLSDYPGDVEASFYRDDALYDAHEGDIELAMEKMELVGKLRTDPIETGIDCLAIGKIYLIAGDWDDAHNYLQRARNVAGRLRMSVNVEQFERNAVFWLMIARIMTKRDFVVLATWIKEYEIGTAHLKATALLRRSGPFCRLVARAAIVRFDN